MMFLQVIILLAGFLFLVKGADWFVAVSYTHLDVYKRQVFIRTQGCFFVYTNSDCFLNSLWNRLKGSIICSILFLTLQWQ